MLTFDVGASHSDFGALAFDARIGQLFDDAPHLVHLAVDVAAVYLETSCPIISKLIDKSIIFSRQIQY